MTTTDLTAYDWECDCGAQATHSFDTVAEAEAAWMAHREDHADLDQADYDYPIDSMNGTVSPCAPGEL